MTGVNYGIWALILGALCNSIGIAPPKLLDQSKSTGIMMIAMFGAIIPALAKVSLNDIGTLLFQVVVIFAAAVAGIFLAGWILPTWKICGSRNLNWGRTVPWIPHKCCTCAGDRYYDWQDRAGTGLY